MGAPAVRIENVQPPATIAAGDRARDLTLEGRDIIDLSQSSPYHVTPSHIVEAGISALQAGLTNISSPKGDPDLMPNVTPLSAKAERFGIKSGFT